MKPVVAMPEPHSAKRDYNERSTFHYVECLQAVGLEPKVISARSSATEIAQALASCQGILLPGSPADVEPQKYGEERQPETNAADPLRDNLDELMIQDAHNLYKPIFAICYGLQILNVWRSGTLIQHLPTTPVNHEAGSKVLRAHEIEVTAGTRLQRLIGKDRDWVNSSHHQAIKRAGDGLQVTAKSIPDGVIEAVEGTNQEHWVLGVQWHPERTFTEERLSKAMFEDFARAVTSWKPRVVRESVVTESK